MTLTIARGILLLFGVSASAQTLATFNLPELFGTTWPTQNIEMKYAGSNPGTGAKMIGPDGMTEVPYQWEPASVCSDSTAMTGCVIVQSNLPANANYTWTLTTGTPSASPTNPVVLTSNSTYYTMTNGLTGVRIIAPASNGTPFNKSPIQGLLLADGTTWTGQGASANLLYTESMANSGNIGNPPLHTAAYTVTGYSVSVIVQGPIKTVVQASYTFTRPQYFVGSTILSPSGTGHYTALITMYANSKSVLIDEDGDMQMQYFIPIYTETTPDTMHFRAHDSQGITSTASVSISQCGYEPPLTVTGATNASPVVIATSAPASPPLSSSNSCAGACTVTITGVGGNTVANGTYYFQTNGYDSTHFALYQDSSLTIPVVGTGAYTSGGTVKASYRGQYVNPTSDGLLDLTYTNDRQTTTACYWNDGGLYGYRGLTVDYPATEAAAPWYFMLLQSAGGSTTPMIGVYEGRFSKQIQSAVGPSTPGPYTSNSDWITSATNAYIQVPTLMRGNSGNLVCSPVPCSDPIVHRNWGIYVSTKADVNAVAQTQPISIEQNMMTGINLSRLYTYQLKFPDPVGGWTPSYLSTSAFNALSNAIQNGTSICGSATCYATLLKNSEGSTWGVNLVNMIAGNSASSVQSALDAMNTVAQSVVAVLACSVAGSDNRWNNPIEYYQLGLTASPANAVLNAILVNPNTTAAQKTQTKAIIALFGSMFWDNDWFPIDNNSGGSVGLTNQLEQYLQYRTQFVLSAQSNPSLSQHNTQALAASANDLATYFSSTGAAAGSTHYQGAFFQPLYLNYVAAQNQGLVSLNSIWPQYAQWEISIQTPPEPRFGNIRKGYSNGNGNTESDVRTGMLAAGLKTINPTIAGNLMWAWNQSNRNGTSLGSVLTEDSQFVTTIPTIDITIGSITPNLTSINIPGYHSHERFNFGTNNETAIWFINGDFYSFGGHRHADDGQTTMYPLGAPMSTDWNANLYYPDTGGRWVHNSLVFDSELSPSLWSDDNIDVGTVATLYNGAVSTEFESFSGSTESVGSFLWTDGLTTWNRRVRTLNYDSSYPIIYVEDAYSGAGATAAKTITWNMMDNGGAVTTPAGSITSTKRFSTGCQSPAGQEPSNGTVNNLSSGLQHFAFTGASWVAHPTGGINWDLWLNPPGNTAQFLLGNWGHGCQDSRDTAEYEVANSVGSFSEIQDILRIHDTGTSMVSIFAPYDKGSTPTRTVSVQSCGTQFVQGSETTCFNDHSATFTNGVKGIVTAYDSSSANGFGATLSGGSQEVVLNNSSSPTQLTWTISGAQSGIRQVTIPGGWTPSPPNPSVIASGNTYSFNFTGGLQATPSIITLVPSGSQPVNPQGKTIVATAGVPVQICANCQPPKSRACTISALSTNVGTIWIGFNSGVSAASMLGTPLGPPTVAGQPGASYSCRPAGDSAIWPLGEMWIDATNSGDGVSYSWN